jgi:D-lyxose ketol-isomerase
LWDSIDFVKQQHFNLPPFAYWTTLDWAGKGHEYDEIRDNMLGWDITDDGWDDFEHFGLVLFTIRNGSQLNPDKYPKPYAEKILISDEKQETPMHFHWYKMEDIINRGGGNLLVQVYNATDDEQLAGTPVVAFVDGRKYEVPAGTIIRLTPGESITLPPRQYHRFYGEPGFGKVLIGEVSQCNDDENDNRFLQEVGRFPKIEEDEAPLHYLCNEYPKAE